MFLPKGASPDDDLASARRARPAPSTRPLALKNADVKCLAGVLNRAVARPLAECCPPSQRGFISGRDTLVHVILADAAARAATLRALDAPWADDPASSPRRRGLPPPRNSRAPSAAVPGSAPFSSPALIFLDFLSAFPAANRDYVLRSLRGAGLPIGALRLAAALYAPTSTLIAAGNGPPVRMLVSAGVPQGCPLSGTAFAVAAQPVVQQLACDAGHRGLALAYADDLGLLLPEMCRLSAASRSLNAFARASAIALKISKCRLVPLRLHDRPRPAVIDAYRRAVERFAPAWRSMSIAFSAPYLGFTVGPAASLAEQWLGPIAKLRSRGVELAVRQVAPSALIGEFNRRGAPCASYVAQLVPPPPDLTRVADSLSERLLHVPHHALPPCVLRAPSAVGLPTPRRADHSAWCALAGASLRLTRSIASAAEVLHAARDEHTPLAFLAGASAAPDMCWWDMPAPVEVISAVLAALATPPRVATAAGAPPAAQRAPGPAPSSGFSRSSRRLVAMPPVGSFFVVPPEVVSAAHAASEGQRFVSAVMLRELAAAPGDDALASALVGRLATAIPSIRHNVCALEGMARALPALRDASQCVAGHVIQAWTNAVPTAHRAQQGRQPCRICGAPWAANKGGDRLVHLVGCARLCGGVISG